MFVMIYLYPVYLCVHTNYLTMDSDQSTGWVGTEHSRNMTRLGSWSLVATVLIVTTRTEHMSEVVSGRTDVGEDNLIKTDVGEDNPIIVVGNKSEYEKLSEVSKLVIKQVEGGRIGRQMFNINLENSRGDNISTISFSPTSLLLSLVTLVTYIFFGAGDLTAKSLMIAQVLNG